MGLHLLNLRVYFIVISDGYSYFTQAISLCTKYNHLGTLSYTPENVPGHLHLFLEKDASPNPAS